MVIPLINTFSQIETDQAAQRSIESISEADTNPMVPQSRERLIPTTISGALREQGPHTLASGDNQMASALILRNDPLEESYETQDEVQHTPVGPHMTRYAFGEGAGFPIAPDLLMIESGPLSAIQEEQGDDVQNTSITDDTSRGPRTDSSLLLDEHYTEAQRLLPGTPADHTVRERPRSLVLSELLLIEPAPDPPSTNLSPNLREDAREERCETHEELPDNSQAPEMAGHPSSALSELAAPDTESIDNHIDQNIPQRIQNLEVFESMSAPLRQGDEEAFMAQSCTP